MITPLLTQLTYEGLIDELIGIRNCELLLPDTIQPLTQIAKLMSSCLFLYFQIPRLQVFLQPAPRPHRLLLLLV